MARPKNHSGEAYSILVAVKLNPEALAHLDRLRGDTPRSTFLRELLRAEVRRTRKK